jgi:hypothetical protein
VKLPSRNVLALNAVAGCVVLFAAGAFVRDTISPKTVEACSLRYHQAQAMSLRNGTALLSPEDLQASFNGLDRGVTENLSIAAIKDGPATVAIGIHYGAGSNFAPTSSNSKGGVSFPWQPRGLPNAISGACLKYHVFVPINFDFSQGGVLPGLAASDTNSIASTPDALETRLIWREAGQLQVAVTRTADGKVVGDRLNGNRTQIEKGRWLQIDHEVILNTPKTSNGIVRLWINNILAVESLGLNLRNNANVNPAGVFAVTHFGGEGIGGAAKKDEKLYFTPFEIRWNKVPSTGS